MKKYGCLLCLILLCAFSATAQVPDNSYINNEGPNWGWLSCGIGGAKEEFIGFNVNAYIPAKRHCFLAQYVYLEELKFQIFGYDPPAKRHELNLTYGKKPAKGNFAILGSAGFCYINESTYEIVGTYVTDPDNWFFGTENIWAERNRSYFGVTLKGQVLLRSKYLGIGPSLVANFTGSGVYASLFLDVALGNLK